MATATVLELPRTTTGFKPPAFNSFERQVIEACAGGAPADAFAAIDAWVTNLTKSSPPSPSKPPVGALKIAAEKLLIDGLCRRVSPAEIALLVREFLEDNLLNPDV